MLWDWAKGKAVGKLDSGHVANVFQVGLGLGMEGTRDGRKGSKGYSVSLGCTIMISVWSRELYIVEVRHYTACLYEFQLQ